MHEEDMIENHDKLCIKKWCQITSILIVKYDPSKVILTERQDNKTSYIIINQS